MHLFYVLGRRRTARNVHEPSETFRNGTGFHTMLKNLEGRAFLGEQIRESAAHLRCAYMRAVKALCINATEERKNSERGSRRRYYNQ